MCNNYLVVSTVSHEIKLPRPGIFPITILKLESEEKWKWNDYRKTHKRELMVSFAEE